MPLTGLQGLVEPVGGGSPPGNSCETEQLTSRYDLALHVPSALGKREKRVSLLT